MKHKLHKTKFSVGDTVVFRQMPSSTPRVEQDNKYVYVVLEHASITEIAIVHGVYRTRGAAEAKQERINNSGYVCILRQRIKGEPNNE